MIDKMPVKLQFGAWPVLPGFFLLPTISHTIPADSVGEIYVRGFLEYFSPIDHEGILRELLRILKPGGRVDVRVPDFMAQCLAFSKKDESDQVRTAMMRAIFGKSDPIRAGLWEYSLSYWLDKVGFTRVERIPTADLHCIAFKAL